MTAQLALHDAATFRASVLGTLTTPRTVPEILAAFGFAYSLSGGDLVVEALLALRDCGLVDMRVRDPDAHGCGSTEWYSTHATEVT